MMALVVPVIRRYWWLMRLWLGKSLDECHLIPMWHRQSVPLGSGRDVISTPPEYETCHPRLLMPALILLMNFLMCSGRMKIGMYRFCNDIGLTVLRWRVFVNIW